MEPKKMIELTVGIVVGLVVFSAILMPMISGPTTAEITYTNEGTPYAEYDGETHTIVVSIDASNALTITTDGENCELPTGYNNTATIVYAEDGYARIALNNGNVRVFVSDSANGLSPSVSDPITISVESSGITMTKGATTYTANCTPLAYIASEGTYVLTTSPRVTADDTIYLAGTTNYSGGNYVGYVAYGTIESLTATTTYSHPSSEPTTTIEGVTATASVSTVSGEFVKINNVVFTATLSDETTLTGTFTYFLAPEKVSYDNPSYVGSDLAGLLGIIPILIIAGLILGIATIAISRRE